MHHTVCETHAFRRAAIQAGLGEADIAEMIEYLASNPLAGNEMPGTGGCRKVRFAGRSKGKSGGYRTITFFTGEELPLFLITVFGKGEKVDLSKKEQNQLRELTKQIVTAYRHKVTKVANGSA
jgi:hypothetical protein